MRIPSPRTREQQLHGMLLREHVLDVPLDHGKPEGPTIELFAREVLRADGSEAERPYLLFLQGGPGFPSPRPHDDSGWLGCALADYRVVLLDQRGTGKSTPVSAAGLQRLGDARTQHDWLVHFRADSIVRDAELLRVALQGKGGKWTLLGQSYGGFCSVHYLSAFPESLSGALITGGLPGLSATADEVYRETYAQQARKNAAYYGRYPDDVARVRDLAGHIASDEVRLPDGSRLSVRGLQTMGISLGQSDGFETLHYLLDEAFECGATPARLGHAFLRGVQNHHAFDTNPIYALLHEMCYTQQGASTWAAQRIRDEFPEFDATEGPLYFTGEMVYPWMFEENATLVGLAEVADLLAERRDWPRLYDVERLSQNKVPVAAAVYHDDPYVPRRLSLETADAIPNVNVWVTNEYEHNGLRADGARILTRLQELLGRS